MPNRFNFDDFDHLCAEALSEDSRMAEEDLAWTEYERWLGYEKRPGEIGAVVCQLTLDFEPLPDPPEAT